MKTINFALICSGLNADALRELFQLPDITLPFCGYRKVLPMHTIVRLEGEGNYTMFYFSDGTRLMVSLTLKKLSARLSPEVFARPHKRNIVNMLYLEEKIPTRHQATVLLANGDRIDVSRRKASSFFQQFDGFRRKVEHLTN